MDDLAAFLGARFDEDERAATHARGTIPIRRPGDGKGHARPSRRLDEHTLDMYSAWFRPERMLADIAAKRRILDEHAHIPGTGVNFTLAEQARAEETMKLLALPYADHHHYREEWKP